MKRICGSCATMSSALFIATLLTVTGSGPAAAVTVYECVDEAGNSSFRDRCPPGTIKKGERQVTGDRKEAPPDITETTKTSPVTLYIGPQCDACDLVRASLQSRGVPFTVKDASKSAEVQQELLKATGSEGGAVVVPTLMVGTESINGYNKKAIDDVLNRAGYPAEGVLAPSEPSPAAPPAAGGEAGESTDTAASEGVDAGAGDAAGAAASEPPTGSGDGAAEAATTAEPSAGQ
jgi:glutaredoxin